MFFRLWFYACKIGLIGFALTFIGFVTSWPLSGTLQTVGLSIVVPLGIIGAILGVAGCFGLRSACPVCGTRGLWVQYERPSIGLECDRCGLIFGNPLLHFTLRVLPDTEPKNTSEFRDP